MEDESHSEEKTDDIEIDAFDLLEGKMSKVAIERLRKQICA
jgi:hypothetical protein